jgi:hypothetical protein
MTGIMAGGARSGQPASASSSPIPEDAPVMRMDFERKKESDIAGIRLASLSQAHSDTSRRRERAPRTF